MTALGIRHCPGVRRLATAGRYDNEENVRMIDFLRLKQSRLGAFKIKGVSHILDRPLDPTKSGGVIDELFSENKFFGGIVILTSNER